MTTVAEKPSKQNKKAKRKAISLEAFKKKYLVKMTYKYEWKNGQLEKEEYMKASERYIIDNIIRKHMETESFRQGNSIMGEADCYFSSLSTYRRPDAAYLTKDQIKNPEEAAEAPALVVEVSSPSNADEQNKEKMLGYLAAGVHMVWYIYPHIKQVWIHTSPKEIVVCYENDVCQADPVVPGFSITVNEIFDK